MFEKVNPSHPDKIADRIAGALVDLAYEIEDNPRIAVEVLIGHGNCYIIAESSVHLDFDAVASAVRRICGDDGVFVDYQEIPQDEHLAKNQAVTMRCGDNGIFRGVPTTMEQRFLTADVRYIYEKYPFDGKYIIDGSKVIACQSNVDGLKGLLTDSAVVNPLGYWTGGINVDSGATNRKLGSDMGDSITGGGLHGKDLSKADVSINIYAWLKAQITRETVEISCAIGDDLVDGKPYSEIVDIARCYIKSLGGFEKFAEWGLIR